MAKILTWHEWSNEDADRVQLLWKLFCFVRYANDVPSVWKLTTPFLTDLQIFLQVPTIEDLLSMQFLNAAVDRTDHSSRLIGSEHVYAVSLVGSHRE